MHRILYQDKACVKSLPMILSTFDFELQFESYARNIYLCFSSHKFRNEIN
jgi:hypothetical protein